MKDQEQRGRGVGRSAHWPGRSRRAGALALLGLASGLGGCLSGCLTPAPTAREVLDVVGFREPLQTFETFRLAFRGRLYDLEYNCLSIGFKERNGLGQTTYREVRDQTFGGFILSRALWKAEVSPVEYPSPRRARLRATYAGRTVVVDLVREDFWETWERRRLQDDGLRAWEDSTELRRAPDGTPCLVGWAPLPSEVASQLVTELRMGQEWKIDDFQEPEGREPALPVPDLQ